MNKSIWGTIHFLKILLFKYLDSFCDNIVYVIVINRVIIYKLFTYCPTYLTSTILHLHTEKLIEMREDYVQL